MDMRDQDESQNVEDARGAGGGGGGGFQFRPVHGIGLGTVAIALIGGWIFGINPLQILDCSAAVTSIPPRPRPCRRRHPRRRIRRRARRRTTPTRKFVSQILRSTEVVWTDYFRQLGRTYENPKLILFTDSYPTACGQGQARPDRSTAPMTGWYIWTWLLRPHDPAAQCAGPVRPRLCDRHEVGHHVQNLLGILGKVDGIRGHSSEADSNALSVKIELQADCFAGVWARRAQQERGWRLEQGDIETALNAASQIGDDTLQRKARGTVVPESFTHGTSAQRVSWFKRGIDSGDINQCDTFGTGTVVAALQAKP